MTAEQVNRILFWTTVAILALSVVLILFAQKFGRQLAAGKEKSAKTTKKIKASKRKEVK